MMHAQSSAPSLAAAVDSQRRQFRDPANCATFGYDQERYQATIAALRRGSYGRVFEPGCSIGELTARLAPRCEQVVATDIASGAVNAARQRCARFPNVEVYKADLGVGLPSGYFDLIVLCEIGHYFAPKKWIEIVLEAAAALEPGGEIIAVHGIGNRLDHVLHGDAVHCLLAAHLPLELISEEHHAGFRLNTWKLP